MDTLILNCDLGENEPPDLSRALLSLVDAANIGCGYHAGNLKKTRDTIQAAHAGDVLIGAHPGLVEKGGRGGQIPSANDFRELLVTQVGGFLKIADDVGASTHYVKLHGTLYHAVEQNEALAKIYLKFLKEQSPELAVFALSGGRFAHLASSSGIRVYQEAFVDRAYQEDGSLVPRSEPNAVLQSPQALARMKQWIEQGSLPTQTGHALRMKADTLCVHGDSPHALEILQQVRKILFQK